MINLSADPDHGSMSADIIAGIGLRARAQHDEILQLIDACLAEAGLTRADVAALATLDRKQAHPALCKAAKVLGVPVLAVHAGQLADDAPNPSQLVRHLIGTESVAEAAAMQFGALLLDKHRSDNVTCALARLDRRQETASLSAARAAVTVSTSSAGP